MSRARARRVLTRSTGKLATAATLRMEAEVPWFRELPADERSWVGLVLQAGIQAFVEWYGTWPNASFDAPEVAARTFGPAPRSLAGVIRLQQTVDLVRLSIEVVESHLDELLGPEDAPDAHLAVSRYAREVAFATAEVYARAAEQRGAWDARLESLVVDAVLRPEPDPHGLSRASALGWSARGAATVVLGSAPESGDVEEVRRIARGLGLDVLCAIQGELLVVLLGGVTDPLKAAAAIEQGFGPGAVVVGPAAEDLEGAHRSAQAALTAHHAAPAWPEAPRPVLSGDLLPERALDGDTTAREHLAGLVAQLSEPLAETLATYLSLGGALEATARALFVHTNTVRYRLRQVEDLTGLSATTPRDAFALRIALVLARL